MNEPLWIGAFALIISTMSIVVIAIKSFGNKSFFKDVSDSIKEFKGVMSEMKDFMRTSYFEEKEHHKQTERTHNEVHEIALITKDSSNVLDSIYDELRRTHTHIDELKGELKDIIK